MKTLTIVLLVILVVLIIACIVLYFLGKRAEKKQAEQQEQLAAVAQTVSMLIIDKGKMRLKEAGFPSIVVEGTPLIPVKKEVKATVSGIYITAVKGLRGPLETPQKKKGFFARLRNK